MESVFLKILNMSLTASYVILVVLLMRQVLKKAPKRYSYYLWAAVGFRLACPVSFSSVISLFNLNTVTIYPSRFGLNLREVPVYDVTNTILPKPATGVPLINEVMEELPLFQQSPYSANPIQIWLFIGMVFWILVMGILILFSLISYWRLGKSLATAVKCEENVYESDQIRSPFIVGMLRPRIYLPFGLSEETKDYVLAHERYHIRRKDYLVKVFAFIALVIHWFNPLVWISFHLMNKDMEMSCDEKVLSISEAGKKVYSTALVSFAANRRFPAASPLAFGESGVKSRIKNVLKWKKPERWVTATALFLCVIVIAACALNPYQNKNVTIGGLSGPLSARLYYQEESAELEKAIEKAVFENHKYDGQPESLYPTESHIVYAKEEIKDQVTGAVTQIKMYLAVNYQEFYFGEKELIEEGGSYCPTIITLDVLEDGTYEVVDYWTPRDGSYYVADIRNHFPIDVAEDVIDNAQDSIKMLIQENYLEAVSEGMNGYGWSPYEEIGDLFEVLASSPEGVMDPVEHIAAHNIEYRKLKYYSMYTLQYCFEQFLAGGQTDVKGHLMSQVCHDLIKEIGRDYVVATNQVSGQEWFEAFVDQARKNWRTHDEEDLKLLCPASYLLYQMQMEEGSRYVKAKAAAEEKYIYEIWGEHQKVREELIDENHDIRYHMAERQLLLEEVGDETVRVRVKIATASLYDLKKECLLKPLGAYVLETELIAGDGISFEHGGYTTYLYDSEIRISATGQLRKKGELPGEAKTWDVRVPLAEFLEE